MISINSFHSETVTEKKKNQLTEQIESKREDPRQTSMLTMLDQIKPMKHQKKKNHIIPFQCFKDPFKERIITIRTSLRKNLRHPNIIGFN